MNFCKNCGTQLNEGATFCQSCGTAVSDGQQSGPVPNQSTQQPNNSFDQILNTPDKTTEFDPQDIAANKVMAILSYLGFLVFIPMFSAKHSKFAQYHCKQGLILFICEVGFGIIAAILLAVFRTSIYGYIIYTPPIISLIIWIGNLALIVLAIIGIVNVTQEKAKELPLIGNFAKK